VQHGDLLIEVLGQGVDLVLVLITARPQLDLGQRLVGEEADITKRVAGGIAEVQQTAFGQEENAL
jgi:hypothetical protein